MAYVFPAPGAAATYTVSRPRWSGFCSLAGALSPISTSGGPAIVVAEDWGGPVVVLAVVVVAVLAEVVGHVDHNGTRPEQERQLQARGGLVVQELVPPAGVDHLRQDDHQGLALEL